MMILDFIAWIAVVYFSMILGAYFQRRRYEMEEVDIPVENEEITEVTAYIEYYDGVMYAWDHEKNEFLGQGSTLDQLQDHISKRCNDLYNSDSINVRMETEHPEVIDIFKKQNI